MENRGKVSVIVPVYNIEKYITATIKSILDQTYSYLELILVDDGSTDRSGEICQKYSRYDSRIKYIYQNNMGMSEARETGVRAVSGDSSYIMFSDGDDLLAPYLLGCLIDRIGEADLATAWIHRMNSEKCDRWKWTDPELDYVVKRMSGKRVYDYRITNETVNKRICCHLPGVLFRRTFFEPFLEVFASKKSVFPQHYLNDAFCMTRLLNNAENVVLIDVTGYIYRMVYNSDSHKLILQSLQRESSKVIYANIRFYKRNGLKNQYQRELTGFYLTILKNWYLAKRNLKDDPSLRMVMMESENYYRKLYTELWNYHPDDIFERLKKATILIFRMHPMIWYYSVGILKYEIGYRLGVMM